MVSYKLSLLKSSKCAKMMMRSAAFRFFNTPRRGKITFLCVSRMVFSDPFFIRSFPSQRIYLKYKTTPTREKYDIKREKWGKESFFFFFLYSLEMMLMVLG